MALPAFASVNDLSVRVPGGVSDDDSARAQAALGDASALIRVIAGKDWVDEDGALVDVPDIVVSVCCRAAQRSFTNPSGVSQETTGPFSSSFPNASSDVYLTKAERKQVRSAAAGNSGVFSIDTAPCVGTSHADVCSLSFGALYCSCGFDISGEPLYGV